MAAAVLVAAPSAFGAISITAAGASLTNFKPGQTATGSGSLTVTDDNPSWSLQAQDQGPGGGKMAAATAGCTGSDSLLSNPLQLSVASPPAGVTSAGTIILSSGSKTVASGSQPLLTPTALTTSYTQVIPLTQAMLAGCAYTLTVTYTLQ